MIPNSDPLRRLHPPLVPEIKAEIGAGLKAARLKKGQSLEAVGQQTRISKKFLEALEENRFEEFPALAYLRGFLKSYCDYLDLDFEAYWRAIQAEAPPAPPSSPAAPVPASPARPTGPKTPTTHPTESAARQAASRHAPDSDAAAVPRALFIAVVAAAGLALWLGRRKPIDRVLGQTESATPLALQPARPAAEPRLVVEFRRETWIRVSAESKPLFEGRVPRNARQEWSAKDLVLRTPDPDALKLTLNGASYALPAPDPAGDYRIGSP